jgi:hypothetical protein
MGDDSIDMEDDHQMTLSILEMTGSIWDIWSLSSTRADPAYQNESWV